MTLRLVIPSRGEVDRELSVAHPWWQFSVRFNVAISQSIPVARIHERDSEGVMMRWGLALKSAGGGVHFSPRGVVHRDTLQSASDLRTAWLRGQRGIVPLAGFFLWQRTPGGHHQPHYVRVVNRPVFGVAALWERVETNEGEVTESCALIAVNANALLADIEITTGQMPGILHRKDYATWLSSTVPRAEELLQPYPHTRMVCHAVAPYVNYLEYDEPALIKPAGR
jgi:putative SOS response-associated peptidase YedK